MSDEAGLWLRYARENREIAQMALDHRLYNPCLQNAQQAAEKALKAAALAKGLVPARTHSIRKLRDDLLRIAINVVLSDEDCDLLDSIYLPSKYPLGSALPNFDPDEAICQRCLALADVALAVAGRIDGDIADEQ